MCSDFMVSVLVSGLSGAGLNPGQGHCVVLLSKILYSCSASLHPGVSIGRVRLVRFTLEDHAYGASRLPKTTVLQSTVNLTLGAILQWLASHPGGRRNTTRHFMLQKPG